MNTPTEGLEGRCPLCETAAMTVCIDIPQVPVHCNVLWPTREAALSAPRGDIELGFCAQCGHLFNLAFNPDLTTYIPGYDNSLHYSPRFQSYATSLASQLIAQYDIHDKDVIEIGCGQGEFLQLLCELGSNQGVGFDPSYSAPATPAGTTTRMTVIADVYSERYAHYPADLICCRHVLEHLSQPADFLAMIRRSIGTRGNPLVFFEVPNALWTLRDLAIWDIIYEHCSYFSAASLAHAFASRGFAVQHLYETFEGQFLCLEARPSIGPTDPPAVVPAAVNTTASAVASFAEKYHQKVADWRANLDQIAFQGQRTVVWGAGSKGVTFLNVLEMRELIAYVVDLNPRKHLKYIAGTGQQIVPPEFLYTYRPEVVIVMNPIYLAEIQARLDTMGLHPVCICP